tara:strand:- start:1671 stop:2444 length:774 start_codon:yes stop_codon:yes gene_type:complete
MKVIILAGGYGTRLSEYTDRIPKPMVSIGDKPILWHLMKIYEYYGHKDFFLALGYKSQVVKDYFLNYKMLNSDFSINLSNGELIPIDQESIDWNITLVNTGMDTMTGGRAKQISKFIGKERCLLTYGDGLSNININELIDFHKSHGKLVTMTAVHPVARFGELDLENNKIISFKEKPSGQTKRGWINGGFFVVEPEFFDLIEKNSTVMEREPLEKVAEMGELMAFKHNGFWQCMDTKKDRDYLEELYSLPSAPWLKS